MAHRPTLGELFQDMVNLVPGFYFCHVFDLGRRPAPFTKWATRDSLPVAPGALRYCRVEIAGAALFVNELGFAVAFQLIPHARSASEARRAYDTDFQVPYDTIKQAMARRFGKCIVGETSFVARIGGSKTVISWNEVCVPGGAADCAVLVEALLIDQLCRSLERRSASFAHESSLAHDRLLVEYAESLFCLSTPAGFLVDKAEIDQMERYFAQWKLGNRVTQLRARFAESVTNTALYRGHLERNRQNALNAMLAAIALLSLAQVSGAIAAVLKKLSIEATEPQLNQAFAAIALFVLLVGGWRHIAKPGMSIWWDNLRRRYAGWALRRRS